MSTQLLRRQLFTLILNLFRLNKISRQNDIKIIESESFGSCVMWTYLYSLETVEPTERQQRLQVCENNWVRRIAGLKRVDRRRMNQLSLEIGVQMRMMGDL